MTAWYNDNDPFIAQWLQQLTATGAIPAGYVDSRSILEITPQDLAGYRQCHFFAGIGGWAYALRLAGWPDREVWSASCPCQPLSSAGQRKGHADERHLWPAFYRLVAECRPAVIFGEQVSSRDGREWLAGVRADLEHLGYAVGAADLPAASVGAPHIRQRLFWVAHAADGRHQPVAGWGGIRSPQAGGFAVSKPCADGAAGGLAHADTTGSQRRHEHAGEYAGQRIARATGESCGMGDAAGNGLGGRRQSQHAHEQGALRLQPLGSGSRGFWDGAVWLPCLDGKARRVEPSIQPLAHAGEWGTGSHVGILRGAGNAIIPALASEFIKAFMEC